MNHATFIDGKQTIELKYYSELKWDYFPLSVFY